MPMAPQRTRPRFIRPRRPGVGGTGGSCNHSIELPFGDTSQPLLLHCWDGEIKLSASLDIQLHYLYFQFMLGGQLP